MVAQILFHLATHLTILLLTLLIWLDIISEQGGEAIVSAPVLLYLESHRKEDCDYIPPSVVSAKRIEEILSRDLAQ